MSVLVTELRSGAYADSIVLMQLQSDLERLEGVQAAGVVMGTGVNLDLLRASDLLDATGEQAGADDLLVAVRAGSRAQAAAAIGQIDRLMQRRRSSESEDYRPRTLESALRLAPDASWVSISIPGRFAGAVTRDALERGCHVFLYSDNVPLEEELELKELALSRGRLLLGPDCGSAIVGGLGFGFTNVVRSGSIGLVCASGTGLQTISSAIHQAGAGISQAIGIGGRDLSTAVGGIAARQAIDLLARDTDTRVLVLASKPPGAEAANRILAQALAVSKPVVVAFTGMAPAGRRLGNLHFARTLTEAAEIAISLANDEPSAAVEGSPGRGVSGFLRGLFSGGTLALEAAHTALPLLLPLYSNLALEGGAHLPDPTRSRGHTIVDLGADSFTVGRLHPMMDPRLRLERLTQEAADPETGLILLDLVLGRGSHADPTTDLAAAIERIRAAGGPPVSIVVVGTDQDPQNLESTLERLTAAGAIVSTDVAAGLAAAVASCVAPPKPLASPVDSTALATPAAVLNVGLEDLHKELQSQDVEAIQLDWRPPAGGDETLLAILQRMKR